MDMHSPRKRQKVDVNTQGKQCPPKWAYCLAQATGNACPDALVWMDAALSFKLLGFIIHDALRGENQSLAAVRCPARADGSSVVLKTDTHVYSL